MMRGDPKARACARRVTRVTLGGRVGLGSWIVLAAEWRDWSERGEPVGTESAITG